MIKIILGISLALIQLSDAYVFLQVRKQDDNHSNIDALIHKTIPSNKLGTFAEQIARKKFQIVPDNENKRAENGRKEILLSVDDKSDPDLLKLIDLAIDHFTKPGVGVPLMRSNKEENQEKDKTEGFKPKKIKFRTGESSVLYEINSESIINGLKDLLASKTVRKYLDQLTRKAAAVFRSMNEPYNNK